MLGSILPLRCLHLIESPTAGWRLPSAVLLGSNLARICWLVVLPTRGIGPEGQVILNPLATRVVWTAGAVSLVLWLLDTVGIPLRSIFHLYYAGLLTTLLVGFALVTDFIDSLIQTPELNDL